MWVLMTGKTLKSYRAIFKFLQKLLPDIKFKTIITDYEENIAKAAAEIYDCIEIIKCYFHFVQVVNFYDFSIFKYTLSLIFDK